MVEEKKEYPDYISMQGSTPEEADACWKRYKTRLDALKSKREKYEYPLNKSSDIFLNFHKYHRAMMVDMKPDKFLKLAIPKGHVRKCSLEYLFDAYEFGEPKLDPLVLEVNEKCQVIGHEGRHRAEIASDLGVETIPVSIGYYPHYTLTTGDDGNKINNDISDLYFKRKEGTYYDAIMKYKNKWVAPNNCTVENLQPESIQRSAIRITDKEGKTPTDLELYLKRRELRKKYGIE